MKKNFFITAIYLKRLNVDCSQLDFIEYSLGEFLERIHDLVKERSMRIGIQDASLFIPTKAGTVFSIRIDSVTDIELEKIILSQGRFSLQRCPGASFCARSTYTEIEPIHYRFGGYLREGGLGIESFELRRQGFYLKLWGETEKSNLVVNGISFVDNPSESTSSKARGGITAMIRRILSLPAKPHPHIIGESTATLKIFDLHCVVQILTTGITIEQLNFSVHNTPFSVQGHISFIGSKGLHLKISSFPEQLPTKRLKNTKRIDIEITGTLRKAKFNGKILADYLRVTKTKKTPQRMETTFKNLAFSIPKKNNLDMVFNKAQFYYRAGDNVYTLPFNRGKASFDFTDRRFKTTAFRWGIYGGLLQGKGIVDIATMPFRCSFDFNMIDVSANKLR